MECREIHAGAPGCPGMGRIGVPSSDIANFSGRGGRVWQTTIDESSHMVYR